MAQEQTQRTIHCWSGPRCCSTALMYAFAQRSDTSVRDEPLYAAYLQRTGIQHPGLDEILAQGDTDGDRVMSGLQQHPRPAERPVLYAKHMAKHKLACRSGLFSQGRHVLLVREPLPVITSFAKVAPPSQQELGYTALLEVLSELRGCGQAPLVLLSQDLVAAPEACLRALCCALDLDWQPAMMAWPPGPKPYDGVWAAHWYAATHASTGFSPAAGAARPGAPRLPPALRPLLAECSALYEVLRANPGVLRPGSSRVPPPLPPLLPQPLPTTPAAAAAGPAAADPLDPTAAAAAGPPAALDQTGSGAGVTSPGESVTSQSGTHAYPADPRNADVLVGIRDGVTLSLDMVWRPAAKVSVLDSGFLLGDGVWEGLRLHRGVLAFCQDHLDRLFEGAAALDMALDLNRQQLADLVYATVDANGMNQASGVHIRLMVTRGLKPTPYQSPYITIGRPTIVVIPEYKAASPAVKQRGIRLFTVHVRRGAPDVQDPGWNSHSKLNCIAACIQAHHAGADEALMLDPHGFVATCNSTNFFIVRKGQVWAPTTKYQMPGITRANVLRLCREQGITARELDFSLTAVYGAEEAFVTGTFAGLIPVISVDGRAVGRGARGPVTERLQECYATLMDECVVRGRAALRD